MLFGLAFMAPSVANAAGGVDDQAVSSPAQASSSRLRWLPYRESDTVARSRLTVAARNDRSRSVPSTQPVRQAAAGPFDNPFGDARTGLPATVAAAAPSPATPLRAPSMPSGKSSDPGPPKLLRPQQEAAPAVVPSPKLQPKPRPKDIKIDFQCRSVNDLSRIGELTDDIGVPAELEKYRLVIQQDLTCGLGKGAYSKRDTVGWAPTTFTWKASGLCHKPLYFEQVHGERYGHSTGPLTHPFVAAGHFFLTVPALPYKMGLYPPFECIYTLGHYRPGSCAPYYLDPFPISVRAALAEAGVWVGAAALVP